VCRFGRLFMFKSNCEGSHFPTGFRFLTPATCRVGQLGKPWYQRAASAKRAPWPIAALAPNALPNGVLVHRSSRLAPTVCVFTLAPPVPSQVLTLLRREGRLLPLVVYETHCKDRAQVRGDTPRTGRAPLERANCTHARDSAARSLSCLGMCAFLSSCPLPDGRAWEAGGRRARSRSPRFGQISASGVGVFPRLSHNLILTLCGTPHTHKALSSSRLHHRLRAHTRPPCARGGCRHPPMCAPHALRA